MPPTTMKAIAISKPGGPDVLIAEDRAVPTPASDQVLIRVIAAGINRPDCFQREGLYPPPPGASDLPGLEVSGEVVAVGSEVARWQTGDRVCALTHGGGYAEYVVAHAGHCLPIPDGMSPILAAAVPETAFTVYSNLWMRAGVWPGDALLIHGGSSGIGSMAIQIAKALGHTVLTTAGTDEKCDFCTALGADLAINYKSGDWLVEAQEHSPDGVDVLLDMVGGVYVEQGLSLLRMDGRYVLIALLGGAVAESINMGHILRKRLTVTGSTLRPQTDSQKTDIATELERDVWPLLASGGVVPMIYEQFPLAQAADAHTLMESGQHMGKIVLNVSE
ncbi:MAG: NAD(P)H-quinone oxidoreductase [Pseudomonadota bacterium]